MDKTQSALSNAQATIGEKESSILQNVLTRLRQENNRFNDTGKSIQSSFLKLSNFTQDPKQEEEGVVIGNAKLAEPTLIDYLWNELVAYSENNSQLERISKEFRTVIG